MDRVRSCLSPRVNSHIVHVPEPSNRGIPAVCCGRALLDPIHGVLGADGAVECVEAESDAGEREEENGGRKPLMDHVCRENIHQPG